ncbi:hypothetical protein C1645_434933 [Glomus cerebriforme]|uniref:Uncharacterized protein n=1 Tax=Glomus cerebriforme TaxID=658196 RepID=A0A397TCJ7_9GLOM|nr:hypothetical protein C1645_434933 [Glomus cerebriforme]
MMNDDENLTICPKFNKLIEDCCAISPTDRPSISDIIRVLDDILADLIEQETMPTSDITTETPFNDPQEKEWTLTNAAAWHQKAEDVHKIVLSLKNNNQVQSAGESDPILQDKKQLEILEQEYREYREKAFKCYQYCGSSTNDSRALYYTGLYLWRKYVKVEEDESEDSTRDGCFLIEFCIIARDLRSKFTQSHKRLFFY